jgi:hypothetical protein
MHRITDDFKLQHVKAMTRGGLEPASSQRESGMLQRSKPGASYGCKLVSSQS